MGPPEAKLLDDRGNPDPRDHRWDDDGGRQELGENSRIPDGNREGKGGGEPQKRPAPGTVAEEMAAAAAFFARRRVHHREASWQGGRATAVCLRRKRGMLDWTCTRINSVYMYICSCVHFIFCVGFFSNFNSLIILTLYFKPLWRF